MDEGDYFYLINRKKDLIKYKGHSVYPRELEEILYEHPEVKLCGVIGKPDPSADDDIASWVILFRLVVSGYSLEDLSTILRLTS